MRKSIVVLLTGIFLASCAPAPDETQNSSANTRGRAQTQSSHYDDLANLPFPGAYPSKESAAILKDELAFQRGVQTYLWALPAMNMYGMREGQRKAFGDDSNIMMIAKDRIDYRLEYSTGNPDVIYAFAWLDLKKEGPTVLEMPPKLQGLLADLWRLCIPAGLSRGG